MVVNDVERYQAFLPACEHSKILNVMSSVYDAELIFAALGVQERVVTRNTPIGNRSLKIELLEGPFSTLEGTWTFKDYGDGCRVTLNLTCEFTSRLLSVFSSAMLTRAVEKTIEAFVLEVRRRHDSN